MKNIISKIFARGEISIGVEFSSNSIKIVQLKKAKDKISLANFAMADLPPDEAKITETIKEALKKKRINPGKANCIFSWIDIIIKEVKLPSISEEELKKAVLWQAEKYISFPVDEAVVDYQIIGNKTKAGSEFDALLVISRKKDIGKAFNKLKVAGLMPVLVDIVPFALVKSYQANYELPSRHIITLLEIGEKISWLVMVNRSGLKLVRSLEIKPAIADGFVRELERSLDYCESKYFGEKVSRIILSGREAKQPGFDKMLSERLAMEVEIANPFKKIEIISGQEEIKDISHVFMTAVGMAL